MFLPMKIRLTLRIQYVMFRVLKPICLLGFLVRFVKCVADGGDVGELWHECVLTRVSSGSLESLEVIEMVALRSYLFWNV